jgi:hypothetical protein
MKFLFTALSFSALSLFVSAGYSAPESLAGYAQIVSTHAPEISYERYKLPNGLEVLLHEDHKPKRALQYSIGTARRGPSPVTS